MPTYLINLDTLQVKARFATRAAAGNMARRMKFNWYIADANRDDLNPLTIGQIVALYNNLCESDESHISVDTNKVQAIAMLADKMTRTQFVDRTISMKATKDVGALEKVAEVKPLRRNSRIGKVVAALANGATIEELCKVADYPDPKRFWRDHNLVRKGYGRQFRAGKYYLVLPAGMDAPIFRD